MVEQLECAAVLDMKWSGARLAVATAKGSLHIYAYREGCGSSCKFFFIFRSSNPGSGSAIQIRN